MNTQIALAALACLFAVALGTGEFNDVCTDNDGCTGLTNGQCVQADGCTTKSCLCNSGYVYYSATSCLKEKKLGDSCTQDAQCVAGSCVSSVCACATGYTADGDDECEGNIALGSSGCDSDNACDAGSCVSGTCECSSGYKADSGDCRYATEGETCDSDVSCDSSKDLTCNSDDVCECSTSTYELFEYYVYKTKSTKCMHPDADRSVGAGESCSSTGVTTSSGAFCKKGYTCWTCPSESSYKCIGGGMNVVASTSLMLLMAAIASLYKL